MSPLEMGKLRSGLVFSTGGLVPGKRMTRSPSPVCTEHEEKGGPSWRGTPEENHRAQTQVTHEGRGRAGAWGKGVVTPLLKIPIEGGMGSL